MQYFLWTFALFYILFALLLYFYQERLIFYPHRLAEDYVFSQFRDTEELFYTAEDGSSIHALYFRCKEPRGLILYFHGNAGALDSWGYAAEDFRRLNYEVLMPDYRGYGKSTGRRSEKALLRDARLLYDDLANRYGPERIVLYGRSLGTGIACALATHVKPALLILETPYLNIAEMAGKLRFIFPVRLLLRYHFRNDNHIRMLSCPVHILHGTSDRIIPYSHAKKLARLYGNPDILTTIPGGGHNNLSGYRAFHNLLQEVLP